MQQTSLQLFDIEHDKPCAAAHQDALRRLAYDMMADELADTTFAHAMQLIVDVMLQTVRERFALSENQLLDFARQFYDRLPAGYQRFIQAPTAALNFWPLMLAEICGCGGYGCGKFE